MFLDHPFIFHKSRPIWDCRGASQDYGTYLPLSQPDARVNMVVIVK